MRFSESWLREWVAVPLSTADLASQLTMAGLEVDSVESAAAPFTSVVVGVVTSVAQHPDADRLKVCRVEVGQEQPLQIVCGAPNVHEGMYAPVALVGADLGPGPRIRATTLRGVDSQGMLCSTKELGLAETSEGLMALPADSAPGTDVRQLLDLDDKVIDIDLTPNRGDCLGMLGIAREVAVLNHRELDVPRVETVEPECDQTFPVELQAPDGCPRYVGRVIRGVNPQACTPRWMMEKLRRAGIRSLGPLVDVTNYVMLELGQPMHAFDLSRLNGGIVVRWARAGERLHLLDGSEIDLDPQSLVIADHEQVVALAGIMGGEASGCDERTRDVFLESAFFSPLTIMGKARSYGLHTESSHRFERGVDPEHQARAVERATVLLIDMAGGEPGPVVEVVDQAHLPRRNPVRLRTARVGRLLGREFPAAEIGGLLQRLGMLVSGGPDEWQVTPPSFRFDIEIEADLIEEVGRIYGYERLPSNRPLARLAMGGRPESEVPKTRLRSLLVARGFQEAVTYSFVAPEVQSVLEPDQTSIPLANPISQDLSVMRTSLWPGLIVALKHNLARQQARVRLFETGLVFQNRGEQTLQTPRIGFVTCGSALEEQWGDSDRPMDFFDLKGDVEALLSLTGSADRFEFVAATHPALHPGRSAALCSDGRQIGRLGALHPDLERTLDLNTGVFVFEADLEAVTAGEVPSFTEISRYPAIRRDLAVVVDEAITAEEVRNCAHTAAGDWLRNLVLFDVYVGPGVEAGRKSLAMGLILQADSRTLTDSEVEAVVHGVQDRLRQELSATLRT